VSSFCEAEHENAKDGCYGFAGHTGRHWSYANAVHDNTGQRDNNHGNMIWEWDNTDEAPAAPVLPAGSAAVVLTEAELGILLTTLQPVTQFFPDLQDKLSAARTAVSK
jgi:hypothetical protein